MSIENFFCCILTTTVSCAIINQSLQNINDTIYHLALLTNDTTFRHLTIQGASMQQDKQVKIIQAFSLVDLLKEVREATLEGYDFDFNTASHFPQQFGLHFHVPMLKGAVQDGSENETVQEERTEGSNEQEQEAPKRGRKKGA